MRVRVCFACILGGPPGSGKGVCLITSSLSTCLGQSASPVTARASCIHKFKEVSNHVYRSVPFAGQCRRTIGSPGIGPGVGHEFASGAVRYPVCIRSGAVAYVHMRPDWAWYPRGAYVLYNFAHISAHVWHARLLLLLYVRSVWYVCTRTCLCIACILGASPAPARAPSAYAW